MIDNFTLTDEQYGTLEDTIVNKYEQGEEEEAAVQDWLDANPDYADTLSQHLGG